MRKLKKVFKITGIVILFLALGFYIFFYWATAPQSDHKVMKAFTDLGVTPLISHEKYKEYSYRKVSVIKDTTLPTLIFVHGTIGSVLDFKRYMADSLLLEKTNMIIYDRVGYNYNDQHSVQESIAFEGTMLASITQGFNPEKTILIGYSYGGPIVLSLRERYKKIILLAPAVYSKVEPMPWMLNLYKWRLTRWIMPPVWQQAPREKLSHKKDLENFEKNWNLNPSDIISIHGDSDWIVPYTNSEYLQDQFPKNQFQLITLKDVGHALIWTHFDKIRDVFLKLID